MLHSLGGVATLAALSFALAAAPTRDHLHLLDLQGAQGAAIDADRPAPPAPSDELRAGDATGSGHLAEPAGGALLCPATAMDLLWSIELDLCRPGYRSPLRRPPIPLARETAQKSA
jgi:hypothetical protein